MLHLAFHFSRIKVSKNSEEEVLISEYHHNVDMLQTKKTKLKIRITYNVYVEHWRQWWKSNTFSVGNYT